MEGWIIDMAGCQTDAVVPTPTPAFYRAVGFNDRNEDGVIEEVSRWQFWRDSEDYRPEADVNRDGEIIQAEAKYYLHHVMRIPAATSRTEYPLTEDDLHVLEPLFRERIEKLSRMDQTQGSPESRDAERMEAFRTIKKLKFWNLAMENTSIFETPAVQITAHLELAADIGKMCRSKTWLHNIDHPYEKIRKLVDRAKEIASEHEVDVTHELTDLRFPHEALELADTLAAPERAVAYSDVARVEYPKDKGKEDQAMFLFQQALGFLADQDLPPNIKLPAQKQIILNMARAGYLDLALATTASLELEDEWLDSYWQEVFLEIVEETAHQGEYRTAMAVFPFYIDRDRIPQAARLIAIAAVESFAPEGIANLDFTKFNYFIQDMADFILVEGRDHRQLKVALRVILEVQLRAGLEPDNPQVEETVSTAIDTGLSTEEIEETINSVMGIR